MYKQADEAKGLTNTNSLDTVRQIGCLPQNYHLILLLNSVNLNISYPKTNRINHSVSFGNMNCLLMHFNPDIFHLKSKVNIHTLKTFQPKLYCFDSSGSPAKLPVKCMLLKRCKVDLKVHFLL